MTTGKCFEAQEVELLLLKCLVTIRRESDRLEIWAVQQETSFRWSALSAIEAGCPLGEGQKPLHAPALVVELFVVAQLNLSRSWKSSKTTSRARLALVIANSSSCRVRFRVGSEDRLLVQTVVTEAAAKLAQNLPSEVFRNLAIVVQLAQGLSYSMQLFFEQKKYLALNGVRNATRL
ncbi:MAG: hypothetical protein V9G14_16995 [Cypionkella sp.]